MGHLDLFTGVSYEDASGHEAMCFTHVGNIAPHSEGAGFDVNIKPGIVVGGELLAFPADESVRPRNNLDVEYLDERFELPF